MAIVSFYLIYFLKTMIYKRGCDFPNSKNPRDAFRQKGLLKNKSVQVNFKDWKNSIY